MQRFRDGFRHLATGFQRDIQAKVEEQLGVIAGTLDIIRNENVAEESEREPEFRERVAEWVESATTELQQIQAEMNESAEN